MGHGLEGLFIGDLVAFVEIGQLDQFADLNIFGVLFEFDQHVL